MPITAEIFQAFLKCETKSYLKFSGVVEPEREYNDWLQCRIVDFHKSCSIQLRSNCRECECLSGTRLRQELDDKHRLLLDCVVQAERIQSRIHALERVTPQNKTRHNPYIPIRFVPNEKIAEHDKLLLAFDAFALYTFTGKMPLFGRILHGAEQKTMKVQFTRLMKTTRSVVDGIAEQQTRATPPPLALNRHCPECVFKERCHQIALDRDELTLLSGMTEKERKKQNGKGIFTVTQLSYTFRPRRKPKRLASKPEKYHHALKALAIRERKIHIVGKPAPNITRSPVYLDVEGIPDQDFYYLIGIRIKKCDSYIQYSFWADGKSEEREIWISFLQTLAKIENPQLIHYGSYETVFFRRMKERYGEILDAPALLDQLVAQSVNLLAVVYGQLYFPTYSNGLKEIAQYLGFQWSENSASGLNTLMWRSKWECTQDPNLKQKLITYNVEDCNALERLAKVIDQICQKEITKVAELRDDEIVHTDSLKREDFHRFKTNEFSMPELKYINESAYWNYQRDKIYIRSSQQLKRLSSKVVKSDAISLPVNKIITCLPPMQCPRCGSTEIVKNGRASKVVYDLKFSNAGIKRWIVRYLFHSYLCHQCGARFSPRHNYWTRNKFGSELMAYVIYQIVDLQIPQITVAQCLQQLFKLNLGRSGVNRLKVRAARLYTSTYEAIRNNIINGKLIHADETAISIEGKRAYVWVLTNLEEVTYFYTETREGDVVQSLLKEFKGVLVTDFYAAYDGINCFQQKCLIHLLRDLNNDLLKKPYNVEFKELVGEFATLLKPMIETIDRFGLKAKFLRKHKAFVERFYNRLFKRDYQNDITVKYKKRFEKNHDKLFTFLDHNGVPWNNNNAEHAIKAFATLRKVIGGTSSDNGIHDYLLLLSICETCKYKGVNFLDFLRSGKKDLYEFLGTQHLKRANRECPVVGNSET